MREGLKLPLLRFVAGLWGLAEEVERHEDEPGEEQERGHDRRQDADAAQVALDVVVLGAFAGRELLAASPGVNRRHAARWSERGGLAGVWRPDRGDGLRLLR